FPRYHLASDVRQHDKRNQEGKMEQKKGINTGPRCHTRSPKHSGIRAKIWKDISRQHQYIIENNENDWDRDECHNVLSPFRRDRHSNHTKAKSKHGSDEDGALNDYDP